MPARTAALAALITVFSMLVALPASAQDCAPGEHTVADATVTSSDGTEIAITVMRPGAADCSDVPLVLHGHGWSGSRATTVDAELNFGTPEIYLDAGYGFVSFDHRGHGDSGGQAHSMQPEFELRDYPAIMDHVHDELDWVVTQPDTGIDKDILVAGYGASYGGGWQTMTQTVDGRLDALVPYITWYDLAQALAPQEVARTAWIALLEAAGEANASMNPQLHAWAAETMVTNRPPEESSEHFRRASPVSYLDDLTTPALFVQGLPDTLFPLNDAVHNYVATRDNGAETALVGINAGHVLPGLQPTGVGAPARDRIDGCTTDLYAHVTDWLDWQLRGDEDARARFERLPRVAVATEQGRCVTADDWPVNDEVLTVDLGDVVVPQGAGTLMLPLLEADEDTTIAGIPRLTADVPVQVDDIVFASLVLQTEDGGWVVDDQVMPLRTELSGESGAVELDMGGVATTVPAGASLYLRIEGANEQFGLNGNRRTGALPMTNLTVELPHATQGTVAPLDTDAGDTTAGGGAPGTSDPAGTPEPELAAALPATGGGLTLAAVLLLGLAAWLRRGRAAS